MRTISSGKKGLCESLMTRNLFVVDMQKNNYYQFNNYVQLRGYYRKRRGYGLSHSVHVKINPFQSNDERKNFYNDSEPEEVSFLKWAP